jgi:hypothetical protein
MVFVLKLPVLFSFARAKEKEPKRKLADCTCAAKILSFFLKRENSQAPLAQTARAS